MNEQLFFSYSLLTLHYSLQRSSENVGGNPVLRQGFGEITRAAQEQLVARLYILC